MNRSAITPTMKYVPLLGALILFGCSGCQTTYTKITVTDFEGDPIAEWIAEGRVKKAEQGFAITAIERTSGGSHPVNTRYPNGWKSTVTGPNIVQQPVDKPQWLAELDGDAAPAE